MPNGDTAPTQSSTGALRAVAAILFIVAVSSLGYGLWRTLVGGQPIEESVFLFAATAICAGLATMFNALASSRSAPKP